VSTTARATDSSAELRRLVALVAAIVFVDTAFYAVVTPLLPHYADDLGLSKAAAGLLSGAYPAGTLAASLPAGWLVTKLGARPVVYVGLATFALSSVAVGFAQSVVVLDAARFVQGAGGACSWAGGLAWLVARAPAERRGELLGTAMGAAIVGALLGPAGGTLAVALSPQVVFCAAVVPAAGLALWAARTPPPAIETGAVATLRSAIVRRDVLSGMWLVTLPALSYGCVAVLSPLGLDAAGASAAAIGATFVVASAAEATVSPLAGRISDRRGRAVPVRIGLTAAAVVLALLATGAGGGIALAALTVALGGGLGLLWSPAMDFLSESAERASISQGYGFGLVNVAWAVGEFGGGAGGGALAKAAGDGVPFALLAAAAGGTLLLGGIVLRRGE
jgi:MFS family permease